MPLDEHLKPKLTSKIIKTLVNSLHLIGASLVGFHFELHGSLCVGDGAVLLVPVVVLHQGWDPLWVHQHVAAKERGLGFSHINNLKLVKKALYCGVLKNTHDIKLKAIYWQDIFDRLFKASAR